MRLGLGLGPGIAPRSASAVEPSGPYAQTRVTFDGADRIFRNSSADFLDGPTGTLSCWFDVGGTDGALQTLFDLGGRLFVSRDGTNKLAVAGLSAAGALVLRLKTTDATFTASRPVVHVMASWNLSASPEYHMYVDGLPVVFETLVATASAAINYSRTAATSIGANSNSTPGAFYTGAMGDMWFNPSYIDLSVAANREKFILGGAPVDLGANGENVTDSAPKIFFGDTMTAADWNSGTSRGSIGTGWAVSGAVS